MRGGEGPGMGGIKASVIDPWPVQLYRTQSLEDPALGLLLYCHRLEILNSEQGSPYFPFALSPLNSVANPGRDLLGSLDNRAWDKTTCATTWLRSVLQQQDWVEKGTDIEKEEEDLQGNNYRAGLYGSKDSWCLNFPGCLLRVHITMASHVNWWLEEKRIYPGFFLFCIFH